MADPLAGVELRHLVALRAVAGAGSFGAAADQLGYTQSAPSTPLVKTSPRYAAARSRHCGSARTRASPQPSCPPCCTGSVSSSRT